MANIDTLTLDIVVNNNNAVRRINNVTKAINNFNNAVSKTENFDKVLGQINNVSPTNVSKSKTKSGSGGINARGVNIFTTLGRLNYYKNMLSYYGRSLAQITQYAMDYVETQNLWQVANRENIAMASEFIEKMNKAYGVSQQALMNYQAIFKNMLSSLGQLSSEVSTKLSQNLTQMALDFSSLYNVSIASSMQKFQAVLSGQVRPIRSVSGYDITENTIYDLYQRMGGEKTMRQLSQLEKRLLRIYAVFEQMQKTGATGDLSKTIESAANQARIMSEQLKETLTWAGQIILQFINSIGLLRYVNAMLMTTRELLKSLAFSMGYEPQDWSIASMFEEANEQVDELQGKLLSFDKFVALNPSEDSSFAGIDPKIEKIIGNMNLKMGEANMEATKISDNWLKQIGLGQQMYKILDANGKTITKTAEEYAKISDAEKSTYKAVETYREMNDELKSSLKALANIGMILGGILAIGITAKVGKLFGSLTGVSSVLGVISKHPIVLTLGIIAGTLSYLYATNEEFRESINKLFLTLSEKIRPVLIALDVFVKALIYDVGELIKAITPALVWLVNRLTDLVNLIDRIVKAVANIGNNVWGKITTFFKGLGGAKLDYNLMTPGMYATGGFPEDGLFFANSGEMVGKFTNGKTAVANNDQIVTGITQGVYAAMMAYNSQTGGNNNQTGDVYLDGTKVGKLVARSSHNEMVRTGLVSKSS